MSLFGIKEKQEAKAAALAEARAKEQAEYESLVAHLEQHEAMDAIVAFISDCEWFPIKRGSWDNKTRTVIVTNTGVCVNTYTSVVNGTFYAMEIKSDSVSIERKFRTETVKRGDEYIKIKDPDQVEAVEDQTRSNDYDSLNIMFESLGYYDLPNKAVFAFADALRNRLKTKFDSLVFGDIETNTHAVTMFTLEVKMIPLKTIV